MSARRQGFTLLEAVVAMAILAMALLAVFDLNAGAIASHTYVKKLTVATMLARSKMADLEQELYDEGFPTDSEEDSGDFSDEGWSGYHWKAKIIAPDMNNLSPDKLMSSLLNLPTGGEGGGLMEMLSGGMGGDGGTAAGGAAGAAGAMGPMGGLVQGQFQQMAQTLHDSVREVRLTVSWKDGDKEDSFDLATHVVSLGPGSDRNGGQIQGVPGSGMQAGGMDGGVGGMGGMGTGNVGGVPNPAGSGGLGGLGKGPFGLPGKK